MALIEELLGTITGDALGIPNQSQGRTWYPIDDPTEQEEGSGDTGTGLYLVTQEQDEEPTRTVFGLGARHTFVQSGVAITPYIYFPLLVMPSEDGETFVLGDPDYPIELGVQVGKAEGSFGTDEVSFEGIQVAATINFGSDPFALELLLLNLKLPGKQPADTSVGALLDIPATEWVSIAAYLLISQIARTEDPLLKNVADSLLSMLGLIGDVPTVKWDALAEDPSEAGQIFADWFRSVGSDPSTFKTWLNDWYCLFHGESPSDGKDYITGEGTRAAPFAIDLLTAAEDGIGVAFTFATVITEETKDLLIYPGIRVTPKVVQPLKGTPAVEIRFDASAEFMELKLPAGSDPPPAPTPFPAFRAMVVLANPTAAFVESGGDAVAAAAEAAAVVSIGTLQAGFEYRRPISKDPQAELAELGIYPKFVANGGQHSLRGLGQHRFLELRRADRNCRRSDDGTGATTVECVLLGNRRFDPGQDVPEHGRRARRDRTARLHERDVAGQRVTAERARRNRSVGCEPSRNPRQLHYALRDHRERRGLGLETAAASVCGHPGRRRGADTRRHGVGNAQRSLANPDVLGRSDDARAVSAVLASCWRGIRRTAHDCDGAGVQGAVAGQRDRHGLQFKGRPVADEFARQQRQGDFYRHVAAGSPRRVPGDWTGWRSFEDAQPGRGRDLGRRVVSRSRMEPSASAGEEPVFPAASSITISS